MKKRITGRMALIYSVGMYHLWGTALIAAVLCGRESPAITTMFDAVCTGIGWGLAILVGAKAVNKIATVGAAKVAA